MQGFDQQKGEIAELFEDWNPPLSPQAAVVESNRCLNCFDAPCTGACPTHIDVPGFISRIANGNVKGSAIGILDQNILGASCARVCPVEVLCEGACVLHGLAQPPIAIGRLQRFAMDRWLETGGTLPRRSSAEHPQKIACVGAGPASLAAAAELKQHGYQVTVFDRRSLPGGLNTYGVAEYKLPVKPSLKEIELIERLGVKFRLGVDIGGELSLDELEREFNFIFLGVGLGSTRALNIPGSTRAGVMDALKFIAAYKTGPIHKVTGDVVVVGAGNTAIDAAVAAVRLGAKNVSILYRRTESWISAFDLEYKRAQQQGVRFHWLIEPVAIHASRTGALSIECVRMEIASNGSVRPVAGSSVRTECDLVLSAIGQSPLSSFLDLRRGVRLQDGLIAIDRATGQTTNPMYFAGGDCVNGGREVVDAVADGRRAGVAIAKVLESAHV